MTAGTSDGVCRMTLKNSKKNLCLSFIAKKNALSKTEKQADIVRWGQKCLRGYGHCGEKSRKRRRGDISLLDCRG